MKFNSNLKIGIFAATALGMALAACSKDESKGKGAQEEATEAPLVKIEKVFETDVMQSGTYTASVDADIINNISSSTPNRIKSITVDVGDLVQKGQPLVYLDDVNLVAYDTQVTNAQTAVDNAKVNLDNIQLNYDRALQLFNIGGGTKQSVDAMETQLATARNQLVAAQSALESARRAKSNASENTVLVSPISGVVTARNYDPGDMTGGLPILTISKVEPVKVVSNISESEFPMVKLGMTIDCTFDVYGDEVFQGKVTKISPTIDTSSRTFGIEVTVPNPDHRILPGMFGRVKVNFGEERHVVVPDQAVVKQPGSGNNYVYVYKDGKVSYNKVELGQRIGSTYELLSGVQDGDEVVISGQSRLANGMEVRLMQ